MSKYIDPNNPGHEDARDKSIGWRGEGRPLGIKVEECPVDGHYCEQPQCENCNFEKVNG